jgi:hypothetical protein
MLRARERVCDEGFAMVGSTEGSVSTGIFVEGRPWKGALSRVKDDKIEKDARQWKKNPQWRGIECVCVFEDGCWMRSY